jgi:fructuronate reductase
VTERLSEASLAQLPSAIERPAYERNALRPGIVHIGLGAFHRAHQAPLFEALAQAGDMRWGIVGASLRSPVVRDALQPQDGLYSLVIKDGEERRTRVIGALRKVIVAPEAPQALVEAIASPETRIITVTVTEKGYRLDPASGALLEDDPDVRGDLAGLNAPTTLPGYIAAGLKLRAERNLSPLTIISCDNMATNGSKLQASVVQIAHAHDAALADWIGKRCAFPNTMVDRIVPATSEADVARATSELGVVDLATVRTEPFSQWVIEDCFAGARPELEREGVQFTSDVAPWGRAKLRLLNGAHSAMAYLGGLAGIATVDAFVDERWGRAFIERLWDELETTLTLPSEIDVPLYRRQLMRRFHNSALNHRLVQIAMDGSQKIPQRLATPAAELLNSGIAPDAVSLAIAAWMRWQAAANDRGDPIVVDDPLASRTQRLVDSTPDASEQVAALLSISSIFPARLSADRAFHQRVADHLQSLQRIGARATVQQFVLERAATMQTRIGG